MPTYRLRCLPSRHTYQYQYGPCAPGPPGVHLRQYGLPQFTHSSTYEPAPRPAAVPGFRAVVLPPACVPFSFLLCADIGEEGSSAHKSTQLRTRVRLEEPETLYAARVFCSRCIARLPHVRSAVPAPETDTVLVRNRLVSSPARRFVCPGHAPLHTAALCPGWSASPSRCSTPHPRAGRPGALAPSARRRPATPSASAGTAARACCAPR